MKSLLQDIRYSFRMLRVAPGFTLITVTVLALGIGANTAMFSALDALLIHPLAFPNASELVMVWQKSSKMAGFLAERTPTSLENYADWKTRGRSFAQMGAFVQASFNLTGVDKPERLGAAEVTWDFFNLLGVLPALGRTFTPEEGEPGKDRVVMLRYDFYQQRFGGDRRILGRSISLDGDPYIVIGVLPRTFHMPHMWQGAAQLNAKVWVPLNTSLNQPAEAIKDWEAFVIARLRAGVTLEQSRQEMSIIAHDLEQKYPDVNRGFSATVFPLYREDVGADSSLVMLALQGAVGFVLLIACANVANLMLARASKRERETAIRMALGATRSRIIGQTLLESLTLGLLGGLIGLLLAAGGMKIINQFAPKGLLGKHELVLDPWVCAFSFLVAVVSGMLFGIVPALHSLRQNINVTLNKTARSLSGNSGRARTLLVVSEVSLAFVLLVGAGLLLRSVRSLQSIDLGFVSDHLLTGHVFLPEAKYQTPQEISAFVTKLLDRLRVLPGVTSASLAGGLPLQAIHAASFHLEGQSVKDNQIADVQYITEDYFQTMGSPVLRGRHFTRQETERENPDVVIMNEVLSRRLWPNDDPIAKAIFLTNPSAPPLRLTLVGIVPDTHQMGVINPPRPEIYLPSRTFSTIYVALRTASDPVTLTTPLIEQILAIDKDQPVSEILSMDTVLGDSIASRRFGMWLVTAFAGLAVLIASVGLYSVLAYIVGQRTHEIGIRLAIGAEPADIIRMVLGQGIKLAFCGLLIGIGVSFLLQRVVADLFFGVRTVDAFTLACSTTILTTVAALASLLPAKRAATVEPLIALRYQ